MQNGSQLPLWVSYLQALTVPCIAVVGALIAAAQMMIARDKFKLDEFTRAYAQRVEIYKATRAILAKAFRDKISEDDIQVYGLHTLDAKFLFDDQLAKYLRDIRQHVAGVARAEAHIGEAPSGDEKNEYQRMRREHLDWLREQGDDHVGFDVRFRPYLFYTRAKPPWLLRWLA